MTKITFRGNPISTSGELPAPGSKAPDFRLVDKNLEDVTLADFSGRRKLISIVPSLDTPTCATSTKKFNEQANDSVMLVVSADLPFAQSRFCSAENTGQVRTLSTMRNGVQGRDFARDYGVLITEGPLAGLTARAVVVLDEQDNVLHSQLVPEIGDEPDYDAALAALRG